MICRTQVHSVGKIVPNVDWHPHINFMFFFVAHIVSRSEIKKGIHLRSPLVRGWPNWYLATSHHACESLLNFNAPAKVRHYFTLKSCPA